MSGPDVTRTELHAWLDGELDAERALAVSAYVRSHPEEAARVDAYRRNDAALAAHFEHVMHEPVPPRLTHLQRPRKRRLLMAAAMAASLMIGGVLGWHLHGYQTQERSAAPSWARRAAVAHAVYSPEVRHPVEVAAQEEKHLVAWLSRRMGATLKIPHLESLGFGLVGGRLLADDRGPVAQFMYQDGGGQRLTLYVRGNREQKRETAFRYIEEGNVRQFYWIDRGLGYALSGEIRRDKLLQVANAVYQHLNP